MAIVIMFQCSIGDKVTKKVVELKNLVRFEKLFIFASFLVQEQVSLVPENRESGANPELYPQL
jgi:hypothetical protein